jgi:hypothetical protein
MVNNLCPRELIRLPEVLDSGWRAIRPMSSSMSIPNRIIAVLIAAWIPFCCCTLRVAAEATQGEDAPATGCCGAASSTPCDGQDPADSDHESGGHCTSCCIKVIPDPPTEWSPQLELAAILMFEVHSIHLLLQDVPLPDSLRARAPDPPPAHTLLQQRCLLLV